MKRTWIAIVLVLCMAFSLLPFGAAASNFTDVKDDAYYAAAVDWAVNHKPQITKGTTATTFSPDKTCTRAEVVTFLWRAIGNEEKMTITNPFVDVPTTEYYYNAAVWASREKITTGTDTTHFSPNEPCTRQQVATFLWRAMGEPPTSLAKSPFTDVQNQGAYSYTAILWAYENGVTNGTSETTFSPEAPCTRGQIVTFLYRAFHMDISVLTKVTTNHPDGSVTGYLFEYDENGLNTRVTSLDGKQWEKHIFDASGNFIKRETPNGTFDVGGNGERVVEVTTDKDAKGRVIKETTKFDDGTVQVVKYEYDGDSDRVLITRDGNDKLLSRTTYNDKGLQTKREYFSPDDSTNPKSVSTFEYDKDGNMIHEHYDSYYSETPGWDDMRYEYDEVGNMVKQIYTTSDGINDVTTMKYDFGQSGRIASVEFTTTDKNGDVTVEKDEYRTITCNARLRYSGHALFPWDF